MTVFVDELRRWCPVMPAPFQGGSCHLTADTEEELHELAQRIGLKRSWFQDTYLPHYDLTASKRRAALDAGAKFVTAKDQAILRIARRNRCARCGGVDTHEPGCAVETKHDRYRDREGSRG